MAQLHTIATPAAACAATKAQGKRGSVQDARAAAASAAPGVTTRNQAVAAAAERCRPRRRHLHDAAHGENEKAQALLPQQLVATRESGVSEETPSQAVSYTPRTRHRVNRAASAARTTLDRQYKQLTCIDVFMKKSRCTPSRAGTWRKRSRASF